MAGSDPNDAPGAPRRRRSNFDPTNIDLTDFDVVAAVGDGIVAVDAEGGLLLLTDRMKEIAGDPGAARTIQDAGPNYRLIQRIMRKAAVDGEPTREEMEIAEESESVIQDMMGYKGRR